MNKFILKFIKFILLASVVLIITNIIIWNLQSEKERFYRYESADLVNKYDFLNSELDFSEKGRLFFGTSKIYRHLNPVLLDSLLADNSKSYNFGHAGLFPFRLFNFIDVWIADNHITKEDIFIELTVPQRINENNYSTVEILNNITIEKLMVYLDEQKFFGAKTIFSSSYLNRFVFISMMKKYTLSGVLNYGNNSYYEGRDKKFLIENRGFYPLYVDNSDRVKQQRNDYLEGDSVILKDQPIKEEYFELKNSKYLDYILNWLGKYKSSKYNFYFIITPRHTNRNLKYLKSLAEKLSQQGYPVIDLANSLEFPELYKHELSFDRGHLNRKGSYYYNLYLAKEIKALRSK